MSCILRTTYGSSSEANYPLSRKYTRVGRGAENELAIDGEGLPDLIFLLERTDDPKVYQLRCRASNVVVLEGATLKADANVPWRVGEEIDVGGCATLLLDDADSTSTRKSSRKSRSAGAGADRDAWRTTPAYSSDDWKSTESLPSKRDASRSAYPSSSSGRPSAKTGDKTRDNAAVPQGKKNEQKSLDKKTVLEIAVIVVCVVAFFVILMTQSSKSRPEIGIRPFAAGDFKSFLSDNDFGDSSIELFHEAYRLEATDPESARQKYLELQRKIRKSATEKSIEFTKSLPTETQSEAEDYERALVFVNRKALATGVKQKKK